MFSAKYTECVYITLTSFTPFLAWMFMSTLLESGTESL